MWRLNQRLHVVSFIWIRALNYYLQACFTAAQVQDSVLSSQDWLHYMKVNSISSNKCDQRHQVMQFFNLLPPATKLRQGNIFTPVCHSVHRGGLCSSMHHMSHDQGRVSVQGVSVQGGLCPGGLCPGDLSPWESLSGEVSVWGLSVQGSLSGGSLSGISVRETPPLYSNEQVVHILLECILVFLCVYRTFSIKMWDGNNIL